MKKALNLFFCILFFLGWGLFYLLDIYSLSSLISEGCFFKVGKPADMNIWLWFISQVLFIFISLLFVKKWIQKMYNSSILFKLKILFFSFVFFTVWILLYFGIVLLSIQFRISHIECF